MRLLKHIALTKRTEKVLVHLTVALFKQEKVNNKKKKKQSVYRIKKAIKSIKLSLRKARIAYTVPAILVLMWVFSSSSSLAKPKSEIFALRSLSSSTLVALMSLWTIFNTDSSCRKARPFAMPRQIFCLVGQFRYSRSLSAPKIKYLSAVKISY